MCDIADADLNRFERLVLKGLRTTALDLLKKKYIDAPILYGLMDRGAHELASIRALLLCLFNSLV
jgi:hypothetical protein